MAGQTGDIRFSLQPPSGQFQCRQQQATEPENPVIKGRQNHRTAHYFIYSRGGKRQTPNINLTNAKQPQINRTFDLS
jgi:hypothetical protein